MLKSAIELQTAAKLGIPLTADFHALGSEKVNKITLAAKLAKYQKPRDANGSRARYYFQRLQRLAKV